MYPIETAISYNNFFTPAVGDLRNIEESFHADDNDRDSVATSIYNCVLAVFQFLAQLFQGCCMSGLAGRDENSQRQEDSMPIDDESVDLSRGADLPVSKFILPYRPLEPDAIRYLGLKASSKLDPQLKLPFDLPFDPTDLMKFMCLYFGELDKNKVELLELDATFAWGGSGGDYCPPGSIELCVMVPGFSITFAYNGEPYQIHTYESGLPDGFFKIEGDEKKLVALYRQS